jgi:hypothetical protein
MCVWHMPEGQVRFDQEIWVPSANLVWRRLDDIFGSYACTKVRKSSSKRHSGRQPEERATNED